jgi:hypothetical protein
MDVYYKSKLSPTNYPSQSPVQSLKTLANDIETCALMEVLENKLQLRERTLTRKYYITHQR